MTREHFDDDDRPGARPAAPQRSPMACAADGCTWVGSSGDNGRFYCVAHASQEPHAAVQISERTEDLRWFAAFFADVQRMVNFPRKGEASWIDYADQFWRKADPSMQPNEAERKAPGLYLYRMLGELRAQAPGRDRPQQHVPQGRTEAFKPKRWQGGDAAPADFAPIAANMLPETMRPKARVIDAPARAFAPEGLDA